MTTRLLFALALLLAPLGCQSRNVPPVGGDLDAHGCLTSGGYQWCEREKSCVRMWELKRERRVPPDQSAEDFCKSSAPKK